MARTALVPSQAATAVLLGAKTEAALKGTATVRAVAVFLSCTIRRMRSSSLAAIAASFAIAAAANAAPPSGDGHAITTQALWAIIATWAGLLFGFLGVIMTIRRDRAATQKDLREMQKQTDSRTTEIIFGIVYAPDYLKRLDDRTKEVARSLAYSEFKYDNRWSERISALETDVRAIRDKLRSRATLRDDERG